MMNNDLIEIRGNTYPVKGELYKLGARWNGRCWRIAPELAEQAQAIVGERAAWACGADPLQTKIGAGLDKRKIT